MGTVVQSGGAAFFALAGVVFSILTALSCDFVVGTLPGLENLGAATYGLFKAGVTIADITECDGYDATDWQGYCGRSFVCLAAIFGFMALLEFLGRAGGCLRNCIGCCVICAGPSLVFLAMVCQGLTFLFLYDRIGRTNLLTLGNGAIYSITAGCCYLLSTCFASSAAKKEREEEYEQGHTRE